jgi:PKHD-type hydroxylase
MYTTNEWYTYEKLIDKKICNKIKGLVKDKWQEATLDTAGIPTKEERRIGRKGDFKPDPKLRISEVFWTADQWIYDIIWPYMQRANEEAGWRFHIKAAESMQITRYRKGGFYNLHRDGSGDYLSAYNNPQNTFLHGHVRKLSMSVILNDDFEGGEFEFATYGKEECNITPIEGETGTVIVFPSWMEHRVAPVTKGIRYSLVSWFVGPPFV